MRYFRFLSIFVQNGAKFTLENQLFCATLFGAVFRSLAIRKIGARGILSPIRLIILLIISRLLLLFCNILITNSIHA